MFGVIEIVTTNGYRKAISKTEIATVGEIKNNGKSNSVITLKNGETIFADDRYDRIIEYWMSKEDMSSRNTTSKENSNNHILESEEQ